MEWIIGGLVFFVIGLLLIVPLTILSIVKVILTGIFCLRERHGERWSSLKGPDVLFALNTTGNEEAFLSNVAFLMTLEGNVDVSQLRDRFHKCFIVKENGDRYKNLWSWIDAQGGYCFQTSSKGTCI